jgi:hypothetical protein
MKKIIGVWMALLGLMAGVWAAEGLTYHAAESPPYFVEWITNAYGQTRRPGPLHLLRLGGEPLRHPVLLPPRGGRGVRRGPGGLRGVEGGSTGRMKKDP